MSQVDPDSKLAADLASYAARNPGKEACVSLSVCFPQSYPFDPPFVRVIEPVIKASLIFRSLFLLFPESSSTLDSLTQR